MFQLKNSNYKLDALLHFQQNGNFGQKFKYFWNFQFFQERYKTLFKNFQSSFKFLIKFEMEGTRKFLIQGGKICKILQLNMKSTGALNFKNYSQFNESQCFSYSA